MSGRTNMAHVYEYIYISIDIFIVLWIGIVMADSGSCLTDQDYMIALIHYAVTYTTIIGNTSVSTIFITAPFILLEVVFLKKMLLASINTSFILDPDTVVVFRCGSTQGLYIFIPFNRVVVIIIYII